MSHALGASPDTHLGCHLYHNTVATDDVTLYLSCLLYIFTAGVRGRCYLRPPSCSHSIFTAGVRGLCHPRPPRSPLQHEVWIPTSASLPPHHFYSWPCVNPLSVTSSVTTSPVLCCVCHMYKGKTVVAPLLLSCEVWVTLGRSLHLALKGTSGDTNTCVLEVILYILATSPGSSITQTRMVKSVFSVNHRCVGLRQSPLAVVRLRSKCFGDSLVGTCG